VVSKSLSLFSVLSVVNSFTHNASQGLFSKLIRTSIIGAGGYAGAELVGLLAGHDAVEIAGLFGSESRGHGAHAGAVGSPASPTASRFDDVFPRFRGQIDLPLEATSLERVLAGAPDAVFLATPHEVSHDLAPALLERGIVVFDLSAAFRLRDPAGYPKHYGFTHAHPALLESAVYGLPEHHAAQIRTADLIALPGCYPTSIVLPLAALIDAGVIDTNQPIIADSTSGVSGAGRSAALKSMFCEVSYQPYGVLSHRHAPEICEHAGADVIFTPHLAPFDRGIVSTIHATLAPGCDEASVRGALEEACGDEPFVRLLPRGVWPSVSAVRCTNFCDIALAVDETRHHLILTSAIDNLVKGAAGQAVQCFNIRFGLPVTAGFAGAGVIAAAKKEIAHA
jgi:N-acetyl-gamma-glutamyl-phosphate reductase